MAAPSSVVVSLLMEFVADMAPATINGPGAQSGAVLTKLRNAVGGEHWTYGTGSGQVDTVYIAEVTVGSGATDSYDFLAAGALTDIFGNTVDMDELKGFMIVPTSGSIILNAPATNTLPLFTDATDLLNVPSGGMCFSWGAAGTEIAASTSSKIDVTESTSAATATYFIAAWGAS